MKLVNENDYIKVNSNTCGELTELLNDAKHPVSITTAKDLKPTTKHAHIKSTEIYWLTNGNLTVEISKEGKEELVKMERGSILVIEPYEFHRVTEASENNEVVVLSSPAWSPEDEILDK